MSDSPGTAAEGGAGDKRGGRLKSTFTLSRKPRESLVLLQNPVQGRCGGSVIVKIVGAPAHPPEHVTALPRDGPTMGTKS